MFGFLNWVTQIVIHLFAWKIRYDAFVQHDLNVYIFQAIVVQPIVTSPTIPQDLTQLWQIQNTPFALHASSLLLCMHSSQ